MKMDELFKIESSEIFTQVLEDVLNNLFVTHTPVFSNIMVNTATITGTKEEIKNIILDTHLNITEVRSLLTAKNYNMDNTNAFISLIEKKKKELLGLTLIHYNCSFGETLNTFDWKLKLVCGTSELKTFSQPLLQLAFNTITGTHKSADRLYEVNNDMLLRLIECLEEIAV